MAITGYFLSSNTDLLLVIVSSASMFLLGLLTYLKDRKSATQRIFLTLSIVSSLYVVLNFASYHIIFTQYSLTILRVVIFLATWHSYLLFRLFLIFPKKEAVLPKWHDTYLFPAVVVTSILTLTPLIFKSILSLSPDGRIQQIEYGPAISLLGISFSYLVLGSLWLLTKKTVNSRGEERSAYSITLIGSIVTYTLLIACNFLLPVVFHNAEFVPLAPMFMLPFIFSTGYAIYRYNLFNIKLISSELFVTAISIVYFAKVISSYQKKDSIVDILVFLATLFFGMLLIGSVKKEVRSREEVQKLAHRLETANWNLGRANEHLKIVDQRKSEFISIASHQLRTPLTAMKGYSSLLLEGSFGSMSPEVTEAVKKIFLSTNRLALMITDFLDISNIEQGTMTYAFSEVDMRELIEDTIEEARGSAEDKNVTFQVQIEPDQSFLVWADRGKIQQVLSNLVDNAIKYTPQGYVKISLHHDVGKNLVRIVISDNGIGIRKEDLTILFGKFARGSEVQKVFTDGSGLGLYVAKQMILAHKGKIWVESEGIGKGSTFSIELLDKDHPDAHPEQKITPAQAGHAITESGSR